MCPHFSLQLRSLSAFILHKLIKLSGLFSRSERVIRAGYLLGKSLRGCCRYGPPYWSPRSPSVCPSFYLTLCLCLSLCCRSVREEEWPAGLWWLHLSIRRRLQRRRSSAQMRLPVPGRSDYFFFLACDIPYVSHCHQGQTHSESVRLSRHLPCSVGGSRLRAHWFLPKTEIFKITSHIVSSL